MNPLVDTKQVKVSMILLQSNKKKTLKSLPFQQTAEQISEKKNRATKALFLEKKLQTNVEVVKSTCEQINKSFFQKHFFFCSFFFFFFVFFTKCKSQQSLRNCLC